jgi:hypothetical protein
MSSNIDKIGKKLLKYPNVTGYAKTLQKRQRDGKVFEEWVLQVHVTRKVSEQKLRKKDVLPKAYDDIPIDVVEVGELRALALKKTDKIRPLVAGISIGNLSITAGTLGFYFEKDGEIFLGSNAHVFSEDPSEATSEETRIVQPGSYDGGSEVVAEYYWHKQLYPLGASNCGIANGVAGIANFVARAFGRHTRLIAITQEVNQIDFAVARILSCPYEFKFFDVDLPPDEFGFVGLGFAGSDQVGIVCKEKYILAEGYKPIGYEGIEVSLGDTVHKTGRTSCHTTAQVIVDSVYETVNYGSYMVAFDDVLMTSKLLEPGDSGSSVWKER